MTENLSRLTKHVSSDLRTLGFSSPNLSVVRALLDIAYIASIKTEENRFVRGSLTYSNPKTPETHSPFLRRADYPSFTRFGHRIALNAGTLVKLSRAIDRWSGSLAVYGTTSSNLFIWGVLDQQVHWNIRLNQEATGGFSPPGILTVNIDGIGDLSVYHGDLFLGRLRQDQVVLRENDVLRSSMIVRRVAPVLRPTATAIASALSNAEETDAIHSTLVQAWTTTISRICIGLRRLGTGGSLLITSKPKVRMLDIVHRFRYRRLGDATILNVLDAVYCSKLEWRDSHLPETARELGFAQADAQDRVDELTGAVKIVTSLAASDGLVLMDLSLGVVGFGVKIKAGGKAHTVYDGPDFSRKKTQAKKIDLSRFGTRHGSMFWYCQADRNAIGLVVSQDGHVRLISSVGQNLTLWDDVKLLGHQHNVGDYARSTRRRQLRRSKIRVRRKLGYSSMPKTVRALLSLNKK